MKFFRLFILKNEAEITTDEFSSDRIFKGAIIGPFHNLILGFRKGFWIIRKPIPALCKRKLEVQKMQVKF